MLSTIDFYILSKLSFIDCDRYICRLVEKIYQQQRQIYILAEDEKMARHFDDLLWTFHDGFLPHAICEERFSEAPIQIGYPMQNSSPGKDLFINLTPTVPEFYANCNDIIELIPADQNLTEAGRKKYSFYKQQGHKIATRKVTL
jgi:DNA polymerase-3 subunit chi